MNNSINSIPTFSNEAVLSYAPGSEERKALRAELKRLKSIEIDIPMTIDGVKVYTDHKIAIHPPHELRHTLGQYSKGDKNHVSMAIEAALKAKEAWELMPWQERAAIFLKAADLIATKYRAQMNARTMLAQSKNVFQAEIDAVCEFCDFLRLNAKFLTEIYAQQPYSPAYNWNRVEYRPLEGFVFALTPFNFTSIAGNLPCSAALMGNTVVWKPAETQIYSAAFTMEVLEEAGMPPGVINLIFVDGNAAGDVIFQNTHFAGLHFTGSTRVFRNIWKQVSQNIEKYKSFPRLVGETGGKDFVLAHPSAMVKELSVALTRGAFEYQGQKCSAASRAYIPASIWPQLLGYIQEDLSSMTMGSPEYFQHFINAVIDAKAFEKITHYIELAKNSPEAEVIIGGTYDRSVGYFIEPTVIKTTNPKFITMQEELFGPVLTVYVYEDQAYDEILNLIDQTSEYALTGALFCQNREVIEYTSRKLRHAAGNFYINDKPTGAVVGQQPFGGARASGTNDKAGSALNLLRWVSPRTVKENFVPPHDYRYPFLSHLD